MPRVRLTYVLDRDHPPGHLLHDQLAVTVVDPRILLDPALPQPDSRRLYDLVARHHNRQPGDWVVLGQLTGELAARGLDWPAIGVDPTRVCHGLTRLCTEGDARDLVAEQPDPVGWLARELVRHHAGDPAMARHAPGWIAAQQAEDDAIVDRYLHAKAHKAHADAHVSPRPDPTLRSADWVADRVADRVWCPSWADSNAGYADTWTDQDEASAVAEGTALYERDLAEHAQQAQQAYSRRRSRWWFHLAWWLAIILLSIGAYRLVA